MHVELAATGDEARPISLDVSEHPVSQAERAPGEPDRVQAVPEKPGGQQGPALPAQHAPEQPSAVPAPTSADDIAAEPSIPPSSPWHADRKSVLHGKSVLIVARRPTALVQQLARMMVANGAHATLATRHPQDGRYAVKHILKQLLQHHQGGPSSTSSSAEPAASLVSSSSTPLNLASLASIHRFADSINSSSQPIDLLVMDTLELNAASTRGRRWYTKEGITGAAQVGFLGPAVLLHLLQPKLAECGTAVLLTASPDHRLAQLDDIKTTLTSWAASTPAATQAAFLAYSRQLAIRLRAQGVQVLAVDTGILSEQPLAGSLLRKLPPLRQVLHLLLPPAADAARLMADVAADEVTRRAGPSTPPTPPLAEQLAPEAQPQQLQAGPSTPPPPLAAEPPSKQLGPEAVTQPQQLQAGPSTPPPPLAAEPPSEQLGPEAESQQLQAANTAAGAEPSTEPSTTASTAAEEGLSGLPSAEGIPQEAEVPSASLDTAVNTVSVDEGEGSSASQRAAAAAQPAGPDTTGAFKDAKEGAEAPRGTGGFQLGGDSPLWSGSAAAAEGVAGDAGSKESDTAQGVHRTGPAMGDGEEGAAGRHGRALEDHPGKADHAFRYYSRGLLASPLLTALDLAGNSTWASRTLHLFTSPLYELTSTSLITAAMLADWPVRTLLLGPAGLLPALLSRLGPVGAQATGLLAQMQQVLPGVVGVPDEARPGWVEVLPSGAVLDEKLGWRLWHLVDCYAGLAVGQA